MLIHTKHTSAKAILKQTDEINIQILEELEKESQQYVKKIANILDANAATLS